MNTNAAIRHGYAHYRILLSELKTVPICPFYLQPKPNNASYLQGIVAVVHRTTNQNISLITEQNASKRSHFEIKLRARHLCEEPFFRFESDGPPHHNNIETIPLPERQVTTPHFHMFNEDGLWIAYKTPVLNDAGQAAAIRGDINLGLAHFAQESNLRNPKGGMPVVAEPQPSLLPQDDTDPLAGKSFAP